MRAGKQQGQPEQAEPARAGPLLTSGSLLGTARLMASRLRVHGARAAQTSKSIYIHDSLGFFPWEVYVNYESDYTTEDIRIFPKCLASFFSPTNNKNLLL